MGRLHRRSAILLAATALGGAAFLIEPAVMGDMTVETETGRLSVGTVRTSLIGAALAQSDTVVLENVSFTTGTTTYSANRIEFSGVTSSRAELEAIFDKAAAVPLAERLARVSAQQMTIPELIAEQVGPGGQHRHIQKNLVATNVKGGLIERITVDSGTIEGSYAKNRTTGSHGRAALTIVDTAAIARLYVERGSASSPMVKLYGGFSVEDLRMKITGEGSGAFQMVRLSGRDFYARSTEETWSGAETLATQLSNTAKPSAEETSRLIGVLGDMLGAFDLAQAESVGIDIHDPKAGQNGGARVARMAYTGAVGGSTPEARVEGMEFFNEKDGKARISTIAFTGFSLENTFRGLKSSQGRDLTTIEPSEWRKLAPTLGTMRISGVDFDLPNDASKAGKGDRVKFTLKAMELSADKPVDGIPPNSRLSIENLAFPVPQDAEIDGLKEIAALGYRTLDLSFVAATFWNEQNNELTIREVSTQVADMGAVTLRGVLGSVTKDVFSMDSAVSLVAWVGAAAKSLDLTVENKGLFDRYLAQESKKQKKTQEALRREFGTVAAVGIPALLGNSSQAKTIGQAVGRFAAKPGRLVISAKAKNEAGLGFADLINLNEPAEALALVDVTATNN